MITILVTTNRKEAISSQIASIYLRKLEEGGEPVRIMSLEDLPHDFVFSALYENSGKNPAFNAFIKELCQSNRLIFVVPEYNNSFPGVLKAFLDGMPYPNPLAGKWAALVGVSTGMQGASLALSHLTDILNYLNVNVLAIKPKLDQIHLHLKESELRHPVYQEFIDEQLRQLVALSSSMKV
jgi:NAD(P)H-dependent FMN reductase